MRLNINLINKIKNFLSFFLVPYLILIFSFKIELISLYKKFLLNFLLKII